MYPAYTARAALDEYALIFFTLLADGYRIQSQQYRMLSSIALLPNMPDEHRRNFLRGLEWASTEPDDILKPDDDYSGIEQVRSMFRT